MITNIKAGIGEVEDSNIVYECTADIELDDEEVNVIDEVCRNFGSNNWDYIEWTADNNTAIYYN